MTKSEQNEGSDITSIEVSSGFGYNTQQPFVQMLIPRADWMTQMSPADARDLAHNLIARDPGNDRMIIVLGNETQSGLEKACLLATMQAEVKYP